MYDVGWGMVLRFLLDRWNGDDVFNRLEGGFFVVGRSEVLGGWRVSDK